jgi:hypothetical protein
MKIRNCRSIPRAISKYLLRIHQISNLLVILSIESLTILKVTATDATIITTVSMKRSPRVGLFPGYDPVEFPFILQ